LVVVSIVSFYQKQFITVACRPVVITPSKRIHPFEFCITARKCLKQKIIAVSINR